MNKSTDMKCRGCGRTVWLMQYGVYRKAIVDSEPVYVVADPNGEQYLRVNGIKVQAREVPTETENAELVYRPHRCGGGKR